MIKTSTAAALLATAATVAAGPLEDFEEIVRRCKAAFDARPGTEVVYVDVAKAWAKRVYPPAQVSYDVRKTDSLVSPFAAHIQVEEALFFEQGGTKEEAAAKAPGVESQTMRRWVRLNFAYQDGAWTLHDGSRRAQLRRPGEADFRLISDAKVTRQALQSDKTPLRSCF